MKRFIYLLGLLLLSSSCTCILSQVPPQTIYANTECEAVLPDYTLQVTASDNCGEVTLRQLPAAGTILTAANPVVDVLITGTDQFGNEAFITVPVSMIDTIPPILEWVTGVASIGEQDVVNMYKNWEQAVKYYGIAEWIYDQSWKPDSLEFAEGVERSLWYFHHTIALDSTEYEEYLTFKNQ
jgi:hypothetical protein